MSRNRDDFSRKIVTQLAQRVGYHCSNPDCGVYTVGPKKGNHDALILGQAAHICAASPRGPRYDPLMTSEQRKGFDNGIWLCQKCARLIDADEIAYPVKLLRSWKENAERCQREALLGKTEVKFNGNEIIKYKYFQNPNQTDRLFGTRVSDLAIRHSTYLQSKLSGTHFTTSSDSKDISIKPRYETQGYFYTSNSIKPIGSAWIEIYEYEQYRQYEIIADYYRFSLISSEDLAYGIRFEFSVEKPSVFDRKRAFMDVLEIAQYDMLYLKLTNGPVAGIEMPINITDFHWHDVRNRLLSYIECMDRLLDIEAYYNIIFHLPPKLTLENINDLYTISDSIHHKPSFLLPGLPLIDKTEECLYLGDLTELQVKEPISDTIDLFNYHFSPYKYYLPAGQYSYDKTRKLFINCSDGVRIICAFSCTQV